MTKAQQIKELDQAIQNKDDELTVFEIGKDIDLHGYANKETERKHQKLKKEFNDLIDQKEALVGKMTVVNGGDVQYYDYFRYDV